MSTTNPYPAPDPDRDSAALVELFFDRLAEELDGCGIDPATRDEVLRQARHRQRQLYLAGNDLPDAAARHNRRYTTAVLAAYQAMSAATGLPSAPTTPTGMPAGSALVSCLTRAFVEPLAAVVADGTRAMLDTAADPFATMVDTARARELDDFGAEFVFEHPVDDDERFHADVHRCGYHEYFRAQGTPQLTPVLCAFDTNWISAIDPARHGFTFARTTTIGLGGAVCPFHFQRTARRTGHA